MSPPLHHVCDRHTTISRRGTSDIEVCLHHGLFRSEIRAWINVAPALGGMLGYHKVWNSHKDKAYQQMVDIITGRNPYDQAQ